MLSCAVGALPAQFPERWSVEFRNAEHAENADLRIDGAGARLLLQTHDSAFIPLRMLHRSGGTISFDLPPYYRHMTGQYTDSVMSGTGENVEHEPVTWLAYPVRWPQMPVPPRVVVRQLVIGGDSGHETIPAALVARMPSPGRLDDSYRALADSAGIRYVAAADRDANYRRSETGLDASMRRALTDAMIGIASRGGDRTFDLLIDGVHGTRSDLHSTALARAPLYQNGFTLESAARALSAMHLIADSADSVSVLEAAWRLWSDPDTASTEKQIAAIADAHLANSIRALLAGYSDASQTWRATVIWLLSHRWVMVHDTLRSPVELMGQFWGVDSLRLPDIVVARRGAPVAFPVADQHDIAARLIRPDNGVATEWLSRGGTGRVMDTWRGFDGGPPTLLVLPGDRRTIMTPAMVERAIPGALFASRDEIHIDPGIHPLVAVAVVMHEWHHLLVNHRRWQAPIAPLRTSREELRVLPDDPWLAEGFAEWATDQTLAPGGAATALIRALQAEKRLALGVRDWTDPHLLGYRLLIAVTSGSTSAHVRDVTIASIGDIASFARAWHIGTGAAASAPLRLPRRFDAIVIPEITFTFDEGAVLDVQRRLRVPTRTRTVQ